MSIRTLQYWLRVAALPPANALVIAARVLRAYELGHGSAASLADVARRLRYDRYTHLGRHVSLAADMSVQDWCGLAPSEAFDRLWGRLIRRCPATSDAPPSDVIALARARAG
jgi:hypothetical protein